MPWKTSEDETTESDEPKGLQQTLEERGFNVQGLQYCGWCKHQYSQVFKKTFGNARSPSLLCLVVRHCTPPEQDYQEVVQPVAPHLEESTSQLPSDVGPGALVEVRWKNYPLIGVVLRKVNDEGQNMVQTLTGDGRIIAHVAYDILYAIPGFIDPFHIKRCGIEEKPINSKELIARVSVAEKLRRFNKSSEDLFNGYAAPFNSVYPTVSALDEEAWSSVTVAEAAKLMRIQPRDLDRNCSVALHAVHSRLIEHSKIHSTYGLAPMWNVSTESRV
ncbi:hypothetical protein BC827DRAFT_1155623 [Russula dissimulans]|nr:hypothetical protein BC827DRAFT_1155623 [Russula dissimulans]